MNPLLDAALDLARRGWPVFPCSPRSKAPLLPRESAPGAKDGGLHLASRDEAQIGQWWRRWPKAMIGVPTGAASGTCVIDLDPRTVAADLMLEALRRWCPWERDPAISRTQSGGLHLVFAMPPEKLGNRAGLFGRIGDAPEEIRAHVDVRADGGYIIVPPSVMESGTFYEWLNLPDELPPLPPKLADAIAKRLDDRERRQDHAPADRPAGRQDAKADDRVARARHRYALAALERETAALRATAEGARGFELNRAAFSLGGLVGAGILSETAARAELMAACEANGLAAKDGRQKTWDNIVRSLAQGAARPIDLSGIGTRAGTSSGNRTSGAGAAPLSDHPPPAAAPPGPSEEIREVPESQAGPAARQEPEKGAGEDETDIRCADLPLTDLGNAQRFLARFGRDFLFVPEWGWLAWDGSRWNGHEAEAMVQRAVHDTIKAIAGEAHQIRLYSRAIDDDGDMEKRKAAWKSGDTSRRFVDPVIDYSDRKGVVRVSDRLAGWCVSSQSNAHLTCVARLAQHYLTRRPECFDADPMAFNVANGTLRFARCDDGDYVRFTPHDRDDLITKLAPVSYDPDATAPLYDRFLERVQPDPAMRRHLHAWAGVSLTASQLARLSFWYGTGRNGKSTLIDAWAHVMGEYSQTIPIESFLDQGRSRRGGEASPDIAALPGVRCLRTSEPEKGSKLAESLVKLVTGGEPLRARHLNRDFFEFVPAFKLVMQGNYKPRIDGTDEGIWARILLVPWTVMIPEAERDADLPAKLKAEAPGILNRLLDGLRDYLDHGLLPTEEVLAATAEYREDSDPIGRFLAECTSRRPPDENVRVGGREIYGVYIAWAKASGEKPASPKGFSRGLQDHGIVRLKSSGIHYRHLSLIKRASDFAGQEIGDGDGD